MNNNQCAWEEIHGFSSPGEFDRFIIYIENQVKVGLANEIEPDPDYGKGELYGGRWFQEKGSGEVWRLINPDPPFKGVWEKVRT
jgi:hypothetical protein